MKNKITPNQQIIMIINNEIVNLPIYSTNIIDQKLIEYQELAKDLNIKAEFKKIAVFEY